MSENEHLGDALLVRRALLAAPASSILDFVDRLNLQPNSRVDVVILAPLRNLKKTRNVSGFASNAPMSAVRFIVDSLTNATLERVVEILGDAAEDPTYEQLASAVDQLADEGVAPLDIAGMLAAAAASGVPATPHCRRLLAEREELALPELEVATPAPILAEVKVVSPEIKEQRKKRREEQKRARQKAQSRPAVKPGRPKPVTSDAQRPALPTSSTPVSTPTSAPTPESRRRDILLTPAESALFDAGHPLAGFVVELDVAFDEGSRDELAMVAKQRPVVVLAGKGNELLVRPISSKDAPDRVVLGAWKRLGLAKPSYVSTERVRVSLEESEVGVRKFGRLNDDEWNALF